MEGVVKAVVVRSVGAVLGAVDNSNLDADNTQREEGVMKQVAEQVLVNRDTDSSVEMLQVEGSGSDTETSFEGVVNSLLGELGEDMVRSIYEKVIGSDVSSGDRVKQVLADVISMVSDEGEVDPSTIARVETYVDLIIVNTSNVANDVMEGVVKAVVVRSVGAVLGAVDNSNLDADNTERRRDVMKQVAEQVLVNRDTDSSVEMLQVEGSASDTETSFEGVVNSLLGELGEDMVRSIYEKVIGSDVSSGDRVKQVLADVISMVSDVSSGDRVKQVLADVIS